MMRPSGVRSRPEDERGRLVPVVGCGSAESFSGLLAEVVSRLEAGAGPGFMGTKVFFGRMGSSFTGSTIAILRGEDGCCLEDLGVMVQMGGRQVGRRVGRSRARGVDKGVDRDAGR